MAPSLLLLSAASASPSRRKKKISIFMSDEEDSTRKNLVHIRMGDETTWQTIVRNYTRVVLFVTAHGLLKAENPTKASRVVNRRHATHALLVFPSSPSREHRTVCRERAFDDPRLNNPLTRVQARKAFAERTPIADGGGGGGSGGGDPVREEEAQRCRPRARVRQRRARVQQRRVQREQRHQRAAPQEAPARRWRWRR